MNYLSIKEASELFKKSISTIRRTVVEIRENKDFQVFMNSSTLKSEQLKTGHSKIYILEAFLRDYYKEPIIQPQVVNEQLNEQLMNSSNEQLNDQLKNRYIDTLEKQLDIKDEQIKQINEAFKNQQDIIYQLQEQLREIKMLESPTIKVEPIVSEKNETEEAKIVPEEKPNKEEEVVLTDYPDQVPGQTMIPIPEDKPDLKEAVETLSKGRQSTLKQAMDLNDLLSEGEKKAEARRKRVQEREEEK
jgi:hypothetical protein